MCKSEYSLNLFLYCNTYSCLCQLWSVHVNKKPLAEIQLFLKMLKTFWGDWKKIIILLQTSSNNFTDFLEKPSKWTPKT